VLGATLWQARPLPCEDPRAALDEDWGPARREQVAVALEGGADRVPPETLTRLDAYAERWIAAHDAVCAAERGEIIDTAAVATRHECVAEAREALGDLALLLAQGESSMLTTIPTWIDELPDLARCDEPTAYVTQRPVPADPALAEAVRSLRLRRALATSKHMSSDYEGAVAILDPAVVDATALGHAPVLAELELARGNARLELGRYDAAEHDLEQAYARAVEHQHPHVALSAAIALAYLVGDLREHHDVGFKWGLTAEALARQPWSRPARLADVMEIVGNVLYEQGRFAMAFERYEQALEIRDGLDPDNPLRSLTIGNMGLVRHQQGRYAEALPFIHEALEQRRADFEPTNPAISVSLTSLAETLHQLGQHAEALRCYQEALEIRAQSLGWAHPQLVDVLVGLGRSWLEMGEPTRALHAYERALAISKEHDPSSSDTADAWLGVAQVLSAHGQLDAAVRHAGRGVRMLEQTVGPRHVHLGAALGMLGELEHEAGERASAREHLERAVEILAPSEGPSTELAAARLALARVLWTFLGERDAARVLAEQSLDASLAAGDPARAQVEAAKAWLAAHEAG
jgi:tetratricopeptide (TPR) repeat protein